MGAKGGGGGVMGLPGCAAARGRRPKTGGCSRCAVAASGQTPPPATPCAPNNCRCCCSAAPLLPQRRWARPTAGRPGQGGAGRGRQIQRGVLARRGRQGRGMRGRMTHGAWPAGAAAAGRSRRSRGTTGARRRRARASPTLRKVCGGGWVGSGGCGDAAWGVGQVALGGWMARAVILRVRGPEDPAGLVPVAGWLSVEKWP